jgi:serine/threonine-protein kinase
MVIVLTLAFLMSAVVTIYTLFRSGDTRVPNVVGKSEAEALQVSQGAGLNVKIQRRNDPTVPANTVIETRPAANSAVKKDSSVTIVVSNGPIQNKSELSPFEWALPVPVTLRLPTLKSNPRQQPAIIRRQEAPTV